jgi:DNA-binding transcriptional LysR family regulator
MLSLQHLRYFQDAAGLGGVGAAARKHRVSSSAVSQAIRGLEAHFEVELLRHSKNRFVLTDEGQALLERSHALFSEADRLEQAMAWSKEAFAGTVTFATQQSLAHHVLPPFLAHLRAAYPAIKPKMRLGTTEVVKTWLEQREVDFILSVDNVAYDAFRTVPILEGRYVLAAAADHEVTSDDGFMIPGGTREALAFKREYEQAHGRPARVVMEIDSWGVIRRMAEHGLGIGLFPDYLLRFDDRHGLREVDVGIPAMPYGVSAYYCSKRNLLSRVGRVFLDELEAFAQR